MEPSLNTQASRWTSRRSVWAFCFLLSLMGGWLGLRLVFLTQFRPPEAPAADLWRSLVTGASRDLFVGLLFTIPLLFWSWLLPDRWFAAGWNRLLLTGGLLTFWMVQI